jgi:hypothetical protein
MLVVDILGFVETTEVGVKENFAADFFRPQAKFDIFAHASATLREKPDRRG